MSVKQIYAEPRHRLIQSKWARSFTNICLAAQVNHAYLGRPGMWQSAEQTGFFHALKLGSSPPSQNYQALDKWVIRFHQSKITSPEVSREQKLPDDYFGLKNVEKERVYKGKPKYSLLASKTGNALWHYLNGAQSQLHLPPAQCCWRALWEHQWSPRFDRLW